MNYRTAREILSEAIEQLDELSPELLRRYKSKASIDKNKADDFIGRENNISKLRARVGLHNIADTRAAIKVGAAKIRSAKRAKGIAMATRKLSGSLAEARMKYAQDAIPSRPELYMLTYSNMDKSDDGPRKFVGKMRKNAKMVYEGAYKGAMEDWLTDLPKPAIAELKAKHGKELAHTGGEGYRDIATKKTLPLHKSIVGILKKHKVKPFAHNIHDSSHVIQMSFHTYHGDMNEAVSDIGQNLKGMPRKAARKLAYALKRWGKGKIGNKEYEVAAARHTRRMGSNARRWGKKLDKSLSDFSARTGIKLK